MTLLAINPHKPDVVGEASELFNFGFGANKEANGSFPL